MNSETPKDGIPASGPGTSHESGHTGQDKPGSLGLENLEPSSDEDLDEAEIGIDSDGESVNFLTAGERKLSISEQRQILAGRRRPDDDNPEEEVEVRSGRRYLQWKEHHKDREMGGLMHDAKTNAPGTATDEPAPTELTPTVVAEIEKTTALAAASQPGITPTETAPLNDPSNPNKPLFDAVLKGVGDLDPARVALTPAEQTNVAAALTASMTQTQGFPREQSDAMQVSVAASDKGDRVFAINGQNPDAPNAVYISVSVEQARAQPLDVSTAQAIAPQQQELQPPKPVQEQSATIETPAPRAIV